MVTVITQNTSVKTTKIVIPHHLEKDVGIVGVLEQVAPEQPTQGRRIALVRERPSSRIDMLCTDLTLRSSTGPWGKRLAIVVYERD